MRHLRVFEALGRLQRFTLASAEQNMSQPAVTQAISKLEEHFCAALFERSPSGSHLTTAGEILTLRVMRLIEQLQVSLAELLAQNNRISVEQVEKKITSNHIRALAALASEASFNAAAAALDISASSLQRIVRELERILHKPICQRTVHGIVLTRFGMELARRMKLATLEIEGALEQIRSASGTISGEITIGIPHLANSTFLGMALSKLTQMHSKVQLVIIERPGEILLQELRFGKLDLVYGVVRHLKVGDDVVEEPLFQDPYCIVVRSDHPLTKKKKISNEDMLPYQWISPRKDTARRLIYDQIFEGVSGKPRIAVVTSSLNVHLALLQTSDFVGLMKREEIRAHERLGTLTPLKLDNLDLFGVVGITTRANWHPTQAQALLLDIMREQAATFVQQMMPEP